MLGCGTSEPGTEPGVDSGAETTLTRDADLTYYFEQFAEIVSREANIPLGILYKLSQLNRWYYEITYRNLKKYKRIYAKYAPRLSRAYLKHLIAQPIGYVGSVTRVLPVVELQGYQGGLRILDTEQPIFSDEFLRQYRPALVNICILTRKPAEFFYKLGVAGKGILRSGVVTSAVYTELPPRSEAELHLARERLRDIDYADAVIPGRYFVDLQLGLDINPLLFHPGVFYINEVLFATASELTWIDTGSQMEPTMCPDIRVIVDNFTHIIAQFKITRTDSIPDVVADMSRPHRRSLVRAPRQPREEPVVQPEFSSDLLLE